MGRRWEDVKREQLSRMSAAGHDAYRTGYERARRAFELGEQIRNLREARGMTQEILAEKAETSQSAVARLEAGGVEPKLDTLERIGAALGVTLVVRFEVPQLEGELQLT
jgi:ribosome-binding protein aMBF1 (putative translation factor)